VRLFSAFGSFNVEFNQISQLLEDLSSRSDALRGYL